MTGMVATHPRDPHIASSERYSETSSAPVEHKALLTLDEVASLLSVSKRTVENLIAQGYLASGIVPGTARARRVSRAQLNAFVESFDGEHGLERLNRTRRPRRR
jgi:excisionase family DNA binding protein